MNPQLDSFLSKYKSIVVFSHPRFGSTALCDILLNYFIDNGIKAFNFNEFLAGNQYLNNDENKLFSKSLSKDYIFLGTEKISLDTRPIPEYIIESKLEWYSRQVDKNFIIFKIQPFDFLNGNHHLIQKYIFDDPRIFKIGLNRLDIQNSLVSHAVAYYFNIWNDNTETLQKKFDNINTQVTLPPGFFNFVMTNIINHNNWLYYNKSKLDKFLWFNELENLSIPELGMKDFNKSKYNKNHISYQERLRRCFVNHQEIYDFVIEAQTILEPLIKSTMDLKNV